MSFWCSCVFLGLECRRNLLWHHLKRMETWFQPNNQLQVNWRVLGSVMLIWLRCVAHFSGILAANLSFSSEKWSFTVKLAYFCPSYRILWSFLKNFAIFRCFLRIFAIFRNFLRFFSFFRSFLTNFLIFRIFLKNFTICSSFLEIFPIFRNFLRILRSFS